MNREKLEAKLHNYEERLKDIAKAIGELRDQVANVAKPKLRNGDFGVFQDGSPRLIVKEKIYDKDGVCGYTNGPDDYYTIFGNIFDLMEGWGKDLTEFELDVNKYFIDERADMSHAPIHIAGNWHTEAEAYKFWCKLGQMIMTLKRKENKCS